MKEFVAINDHTRRVTTTNITHLDTYASNYIHFGLWSLVLFKGSKLTETEVNQGLKWLSQFGPQDQSDHLKDKDPSEHPLQSCATSVLIFTSHGSMVILQ